MPNLNEIGFPLLQGSLHGGEPTVAKNTSVRWIEQIKLWGQKSNFVAIRLGYFLRTSNPSGAMSNSPTNCVGPFPADPKNPFFLKQMFLDKTPAQRRTGLWAASSPKSQSRLSRPNRSEYTGTVPLVGAVRLLALREGVEETRRWSASARSEARCIQRQRAGRLSAAFSLLAEILLKKAACRLQ